MSFYLELHGIDRILLGTRLKSSFGAFSMQMAFLEYIISRFIFILIRVFFGWMLVSCATGNVGRHVVSAFEDAGVSVFKSSSRARDDDASCRRLDFGDAESFASALENVRCVLLLRPPAMSDVSPLVDLARYAASLPQSPHIVFVSTKGAQTSRFIPHHAMESFLSENYPSWTIVRPSFFAQNLSTMYRDDIVGHDAPYMPAAKSRLAFVDLRDVGEACAQIMTNHESHPQAIYEFSGPRAFSLDEVAQMLSVTLQRRITYQPTWPFWYVFHLYWHRQNALLEAAVKTAIQIAMRWDDGAVSPHLEEIMGHPARDVREFIIDHVDLFQREEDEHVTLPRRASLGNVALNK